VLGNRVVVGGALGISGGRIVSVLHEERAAAAGAVVRDYSGRYIMPGIVDTHVHAGSFETEGMVSTTSAAAAGGVTTIVDMPYDHNEPVMRVGRLSEKVRKVEGEAIVDVGLYGTIAKVGGVHAIEELVEGGVCAFKFSLYEYDERRFPRIADGDLLDAFERLSGTNVPVVLHSELQEVVEYALERAFETARENEPRAHGATHPPVSETAAVAKALELAHASRVRLHIAHCTLPRTFRLIELYRQMGADVSGETCAHYLAMSEDDVARLGPIAKVNPPIRDARALRGLWEALRSGSIATISTDHAAWPVETKQRSMLRASAGMPGLETFLPLMVTAARAHGMPLPELIEHMTSRPAELFGVGDRKGRLAAGLDADFTVFDARRKTIFHASRSFTNARWSPFDGVELDGCVEATYVRGTLVYENGRVVATPGSGAWLRRTS